MRIFLQYCFYFLFLTFLCAMERALGLPFFFFALVTFFLTSLPLPIRAIAWGILGVIGATLYSAPLTLMLVLLLGLIASVEFKASFFSRESIKVWLAVLGSSLVLGYFLEIVWTPVLFFFHVCWSILLLVMIRWWFAHRERRGALTLQTFLRRQNFYG